MKLLLLFALPAAVGATCLSPRNNAQCTNLMNAFSQTAAFSFHQSASCFNFCNGQFQNTNTFFFGSSTCVTGCRHADRTIGSAASLFGSPNTAAAQVTNPSMNTGFGQVSTPSTGSANALWNFHSNMNQNTAAAQVTNPSMNTGFGQVSTPSTGSANVLWNFHSNMNQNTAAAQVSRPATTTTASNGVSWFFPSTSTQVASAQVVPNQGAAQVVNPSSFVAVPAPAPQIFVTPARTTATVTTISGQNSFASQHGGRGTIAAASVSGPRGTVNAVVTGAGKAIPIAQRTNIASGQIRTPSRCSGGKMGSCGKMGGSYYRSRVQSYEALSGVEESASVVPSVAVAATSAVLLWNVL